MARSRARGRYDHFDAAMDEEAAAWYEPPAARRRRFDQLAKGDQNATEVDRSGSLAHLEHAAKRLRRAHASKRVLRVPQWDMDAAVEAMRNAGVSGVVSNLSGTRRLKVRPRRDHGPAGPGF